MWIHCIAQLFGVVSLVIWRSTTDPFPSSTSTIGDRWNEGTYELHWTPYGVEVNESIEEGSHDRNVMIPVLYVRYIAGLLLRSLKEVSQEIASGPTVDSVRKSRVRQHFLAIRGR